MSDNKLKIAICERYTLSVEEAAVYFRIGENKLRKIISENQDADFILWNGNRPQIKRKNLKTISTKSTQFNIYLKKEPAYVIL